MSDKDTLAARIAALAEEAPEFDGKARRLATNDLDAILEAIDTTVLPAVLQFDAGKGRISASVAGRRLHTIKSVEGDLKVRSTLIDLPLSMEDDDARGQVAQLLKAFADLGAEGMTVTAEPAENDLLEDADSLSVSALRSDLDIGLDDGDLPALDRFMNRADSHIKASIHLRAGSVMKTGGSVATVAMLKVAVTTQLGAFLKSRLADCPSHEDPSITCLLDALEPGIGIFVATIGEDSVLGAFESGDAIAINALFQRVL